MFFSYFPQSLFEVKNRENILVTDFLRAIKIDPALKDNPLFFQIYNAMDNETPEIISHKFYKTTAYHWVIMLLNEKFDFIEDFPKSDVVVRKKTLDKYGSLDGIHHYKDSAGFYRDWETDRKSTRLNSSHLKLSRMPSSA